MIKFDLRAEGLLRPGQLQAWTKQRQQEVHRAVRRGMYDGKPDAERMIATHVASRLNVRKAGLAKSVRGRVFAERTDRLPIMGFGSKAQALMDAHNEGVTIRAGNGHALLIPINTRKDRRIGRKAFAKLIEALTNKGEAYFRKVNGKVIVFAESNRETAPYLRRFERKQRLSKKQQRAEEVPIAVLVPEARLRKRLDFDAVGRQIAPMVARKIQERLAEVGRQP